MGSTERKKWIDIARGIGILSIILMHCQPPKYIGMFLSTYSVQLLFIISGCCFSCKEKNFFSFILLKANRLLIPYFLLGTVIILFRALKDYLLIKNGFPFISYLKLLFIQKSFTSLWFLPCLFLTSIIFYIIIKITKDNLQYSCSISLILMIMSFAYYRSEGGTLPWNIDTSLVAVFFLWLGYTIRKLNLIEIMINHIKMISLLIILCLIIDVLLMLINYNIVYSGVSMAYHNYKNETITLIGSLLASLGFMLFSTKTSSKYLEYIGQNSMIYFAFNQSIVYMALQWILTKLGYCHSDGLLGFIRAFICFGIILLILYPIERITTKKFPFMVNGINYKKY